MITRIMITRFVNASLHLVFMVLHIYNFLYNYLYKKTNEKKWYKIYDNNVRVIRKCFMRDAS